MGIFSSNSKTLISKAPERTFEETIKTILAVDKTNPSLCNTYLVKRLIQCLGVGHFYTPIEAASFLGAFGESMVFILRDVFCNRCILKLSIADYRDKVQYLENGTIKEKRVSNEDKEIFKQRFLGGVKNQLDVERLLSTEIFGERHKYSIPRVLLTCTKPLFVIMEYIEGIDIFSYAETLKTNLEVLELFYPLLDFVDKLDSLGLMHRDIKPSNIIIASPRGTNKNIPVPYLLDWGQSKIQKMRGLTAPICGFGTPPYTSPQCGPMGEYAKATIVDDIYSLGVLLWELLTKKRASAIISASDYGDKKYMNALHTNRSLELDERLRIPYLVATQFEPTKRFASAADFKKVLSQRAEMIKQKQASFRIKTLEGLPEGGKGELVDCTSFIDVTVEGSEGKASAYKPRKVLKTMDTMPIELIEEKRPLDKAINLMLSAVEKARRRSK